MLSSVVTKLFFVVLDSLFYEDKERECNTRFIVLAHSGIHLNSGVGQFSTTLFQHHQVKNMVNVLKI